MEKEHSLANPRPAPKQWAGWAMGLALFAAAGLSAWDLAIAAGSALACDATTGATCKVTGVKTTLTQATISWTEQRHNYSRTFCYGIGSPTKCAEVSSRASGVKNQVVTGLTARTKYAYKFYGTYHSSIRSVVTGTFTTDSTGCGTSLITVVEVDGVALSASGDSLENVIAVISKQTGGQVMDRDTSDRSGGFHFEVDPGTYVITLSYPPFTAPAPYTATVITSKPLTIPDQIFKDAFQLGGTVVASGNGDSLMGATVTVLRKADNSVAATRVTDQDGHFSAGLKPGDYLINATYLGHVMDPPLAVTVTKSMELPNLLMPLSSGLRTESGPARDAPWDAPGADYDAKGARLPKRAAPAIEKFRIGN
jgi:hypothetical protein